MNSRRQFVQAALATVGTALTGTMLAGAEQSPSTTGGLPGRTSMETAKHDYCNKPFTVGVALGESTTAGGSATSRDLCWVSKLADLISESQLQPIRMINSGIGGNVISRRSPSYEDSGKPSAMERYQKQVIDHRT